MVRALNDGGMVFEGKGDKSVGQALTAVGTGGLPRQIGPSGKRGSRLRCCETLTSSGIVEVERRGRGPGRRKR